MEKYLRHYAEPETAALDGLLAALPGALGWQNVMVIPACNESAGFLRPPPACDGRSLMVLVINESETATSTVSANNRALAATVQQRFEACWQSTGEYPGFGLSLLRDAENPRDVLLVDRFSKGRGLPVGGGVGQARKIGVDLAAALIHRGLIHSHWIHCTDADVKLPETYFSRCNRADVKPSQYAALNYPFRHCDDPARAESKHVVAATRLYELSLRYYVAGMKYATSPYAFHTIGSTMAVNVSHYAKVRGFPKRAAGEDFYLLNKLAKVGGVLSLAIDSDCAPLEIEARRSDRVPFGTGAAVNRMVDLADLLNDYRFYDPAVFELLRLWLQSLPAVWRSRSSHLGVDVFSIAADAPDQDAGLQSLLESLQELKVEKALEHAFRQSADLEQFSRQMHTWFDAFRTLKLIHVLRDRILPTISLATLESNQTFCKLLARDPELSVFNEQTQVLKQGI
jgi:hypothetical protein